MNRELVQYQADLKFPSLSDPEIKALRAIAENYKFSPQIKKNSFKFLYNGRDAEFHVIEFLREIASLLVEADGEIRSETIWENDDETSESYKISDGNLKKVEKVASVSIFA